MWKILWKLWKIKSKTYATEKFGESEIICEIDGKNEEKLWFDLISCESLSW